MSEKNDKILEKMRKRFEASSNAELNNRAAAKEDIEFTYGKQWSDAALSERNSEDRPCLTINKLAKFVSRVVGEQRQNRLRIKVAPVDSTGDPEVAEIYSDIIRNIENHSNAEAAYYTAFLHSVSGGFGYFRILTEYEDEDSFNQCIKIKRILNPLSVYMDQDSIEFDYSDANYCFLTSWMDKEDFENQYPGKSSSDIGGSPTGGDENEDRKGWVKDGYVRVAEYYYRVPEKVELVQITGLDGEEDVRELKDGVTEKTLEADGYVIGKKRMKKSYTLYWAKVSCNDILEGPNEVDGKYIPVVPVLGHEVYLDGERRYRSLIRDAKDPQRAYNYYRTMVTEYLSTVPKAPYLLTPEQIKGHGEAWARANNKNQPFLLYNTSPAGRPQKEPPPPIATGALQEASIAQADLEDTIGVFGASFGKQGNERSGSAINAREAQGSITTFTFTDNLKRAIIYAGKILVDLIPRVYDTERILRIRGIDGTDNIIEINKKILNEDGEEEIIHDLSVGKYDIEIDAGAGYLTKRMETSDKMIQLMQYAPKEIMPYIFDIVVKNLDIPNGEELSKRVEGIINPPQPQGLPQPPPTGFVG